MTTRASKAVRNWKISEEQRALLPEISGNEINGLGESDRRRPDIVYWPNDSVRASGSEIPQVSKHPYGPVISWFRTQTSKPVMETYTDFANRAPRVLDEVSPDVVEDTAENWTARVKSFVLEDETELVGITALRSDWFFSDQEVPDLDWVIVIGALMNYDRMQHVPPSMDDPQAAVEVGAIYNKVDRVAGRLANWIRSQGWYAENQGGPNSGQMTLIPAALACGFGELGKHGSIINREYGSLIRLSCVRTSLPLLPDDVDEFGADDFCARCQVCTNACPVDAIAPEKQLVRGDMKWYVNFDKCIPFFNEHQSCAICISVCPWSRPGTAPKLAEKMIKRRQRLGQTGTSVSGVSRPVSRVPGLWPGPWSQGS